MEATVSQENGLTLSIAPHPTSGNELIIVRLSGTKFLAEITVCNEASEEETLSLSAFLLKSSSIQAGQTLDWRSACQDLAFKATLNPELSKLVLLQVYFGSNSNDECDWQVNATLLLQQKQLHNFGSAVPLL